MNLSKNTVKLKKNGFTYAKQKFNVFINCMICDAPAKAFLKCIKGHTGFYGCDKCEKEGMWIDHRMVFTNENARIHTDETFLMRTNKDHHLSDSPF